MPDPLDSARPLWLSLKEGTWSLEFESLERLSHVVFNPIVYTVEGQEPILAALERMGAGESLVALAHQLFDQNAENPQERLRFEPKEDSWIPAASDQFSFARHSPPQSSESTARRIAARRQLLKRNLSKIGAFDQSGSTNIEALERRVAELEAQLRELAKSGLVKSAPAERTPSEEAASEVSAQDEAPELAPIPGPDILKQQANDEETDSASSEDLADDEPSDSDEADAADSDEVDAADSDEVDAADSDEADAADSDEVDAADSDEVDAADSDESGAADSDEADAAEVEESAEEPEEDKPRSLVDLPALQKVQSTLQMLIGNEILLKAVPPDEATILSSVETKLFVSSLVDDTGQVVGAMVTDLVATIHIGGGLLMMPSPALDEQIEAGTPDQDVLESLSEVFNTISALVNESSGNPHVRTQAVEQLDFDTYSWITSSPLKTEFEEDHGGRLIIASR